MRSDVGRRVAYFLTVLALFPVAASAGWPVGSRIDDSVVVDITPEGLGSLQALLGDFIPPRIDVPPISEADENGCAFGGCLYAYDIDVSNMYVEVTIDRMDFVPSPPDTLTIDADATIIVNTPSDPALLAIDIELFGGSIIDDTCDLYVDPVQIALNLPLQLTLVPDPNGVDVDGDNVPDTKLMDVVIPPIDLGLYADGNDINFDSCGLASVINSVNTVTSFFGFDLYDLILDQFTPMIDDLVAELPAEIEPVIEDTFNGLIISEELDLLGTPLTFTVWPEDLRMAAGGLRMSLASVTDVPMNSCIEQFGIDESVSTPSVLPNVGEMPGSLPWPAHAGAVVDDDFVNQVLYGVWAGGTLCYELPDPTGSLDLPLPIDSNLLNLLAPEVYEDLFPETAPLKIVTRPTEPPRLDPDGTKDVNVALDGLGLGFFAQVDGRQVRLLNIGLTADIGLDLDYDGTTGDMSLGIDLDSGAFVPTVDVNEFRPDASAQIEDSFGTLFDSLVGPLLGGVLGDTTFAIPSFEGLGLTEMAVEPAGVDGEMIGAYVQTGLVPFESAGCDEDGGCSGGCEGGCAAGGVPSRMVLLVPLVLAGLRRAQHGLVPPQPRRPRAPDSP